MCFSPKGPEHAKVDQVWGLFFLPKLGSRCIYSVLLWLSADGGVRERQAGMPSAQGQEQGDELKADSY